jgi:hypothetical protein
VTDALLRGRRRLAPMTRRALHETLVALALTVVLLFLGAGLLSLGSVPASDAFLRQGPAGLVAILTVPVLLWALLVAAATVLARRRSPVFKFTVNALQSVVVAAFTAAFWTALALAQGGFASLLIGVAVSHSLLFAVAALLSLAVSHLLVFRSAPSPLPRIA